MRNIAVKDSKYEGRLQLIANTRTQMTCVDTNGNIRSFLHFVLQWKSGLSECQCQHGVVDVSLANVSVLNRLYSQTLLTS